MTGEKASQVEPTPAGAGRASPAFLESAKKVAGSALGQREAGLLGLLIVLLLTVRGLSSTFWTGGNVRAIALGIALLLVVSAGETVVMLGRNWDLSVGSIVGLSAMTVGLLLERYPGLPIAAALVAGVGVGCGIGLVNGYVVGYLRVPSIILTLGMLSVVSGLTYIVANGGQIDPNQVPLALTGLSLTSPVGVPAIILISIGVAVLVGIWLRWTRTGRSVYALGSNPDAAALRGLRASRLALLTFVLSGAAAGLAGVMYLSQYGLVQVTAGSGLELQSITIVIVGGTSAFGGSGSMVGTFIACVLLGSMTNGLAVLGLSTFWQDTAYGMLLVGAVVLNASLRNRRARADVPRPGLG